MSVRVRALALAGVALAAAGWAGVLVDAHRKAVYHQLEPGILCGADGGCGEVLASEWSTIGGVAVSAPAIPLYLLLAFVGLAVAANRLPPARAAATVVPWAAAGVVFSLGLLALMLGSIGHLCRYCLVMDALALGVLGLGLSLHPPRQALRSLPLGDLATVGVFVVLGTAAFRAAFPEPRHEGGVVVIEEGAPAPPPSEGAVVVRIPKAVVPSPIGPATPTTGPDDAPVTIVVFEDFECPHCKRLTGYLHAVRDAHPERFRLAFRHYPMNPSCNPGATNLLHPDACRAAVAAECARRQGRFWELYDVLFVNNRALGDADLSRYAAELGLDGGAFAQCLADPTAAAAVAADARAGAALGVSGTPTLFVNGRKFVGAQSVAVLEALADALDDRPAPASAAAASHASPTPATVEEVTGAVSGPPTVELAGPRGAFSIDAFEASLEGGKAMSRAGVAPARGITWFEADTACRAAGKRLCTEDEWLFACTGAATADRDGDGQLSEAATGRAHPYGADLDPTRCASARSRNDPRPLLTGDHPGCGTPEGVYDLEGGVKEWIGLAPDTAGLKGGSYFSKDSARCAYFKEGEAPDAPDASNGFRCCSGPTPPVVDHHPGGKVGDTVREWSLTRMDAAGGTIGSDSLRGKPYVITFWASWCEPCRRELPELAKVWRRNEGKLEIVAIGIDQVAAKGLAFLQQVPLPFPVAHDPGGKLMEGFATRGTPTTFWVTRSGRIRQRTIGFDDKNPGALMSNAAALLEAP